MTATIKQTELQKVIDDLRAENAMLRNLMATVQEALINILPLCNGDGDLPTQEFLDEITCEFRIHQTVAAKLWAEGYRTVDQVTDFFDQPDY